MNDPHMTARGVIADAEMDRRIRNVAQRENGPPLTVRYLPGHGPRPDLKLAGGRTARQVLLRHLTEKGAMTARRARDELGLDLAQIHRTLGLFERDGLVAKAGMTVALLGRPVQKWAAVNDEQEAA